MSVVDTHIDIPPDLMNWCYRYKRGEWNPGFLRLCDDGRVEILLPEEFDDKTSGLSWSMACMVRLIAISW